VTYFDTYVRVLSALGLGWMVYASRNSIQLNSRDKFFVMFGCLGVVLTIGVVSDLLFSSVAERVDLHVALARESPIIQHTELTLSLTLL